MNASGRWLTWWLCAALWATVAFASAQEATSNDPADKKSRHQTTSEEAVASGKQALNNPKKLPWYDEERDDVRPINVDAEGDGRQFNNRNSRWNSAPAKEVKSSSNNSNWQWGNWDFFGTVMKVLLSIVLVVVVAGLVYLLVRAYLNQEEAAVASTKVTITETTEDDSERIESLPFTVARPRGDLLSEALAQYQAGNFRQAVIYLYSHLLLQLDRHQQIRLARGKTNRTYLRELRQRPDLRTTLEQTMVAFEDVYFGNHTLTREQFEACWNQLDRFHERIEQVTA